MTESSYIVVKRQPIIINAHCYVDNVMSHAMPKTEAMRFMLARGWSAECKVIQAYPIQLRWRSNG